MSRLTHLFVFGAFAACAALQVGCTTAGRAVRGADADVRDEGWAEAGALEVADVARGQRLAFDLGAQPVKAVRLEVVGRLDGKAKLTVCELCPPQAVPFPASALTGTVEVVVQQAHAARTLTLDYAPEGVSSGGLQVRVWRRATDLP